MDALWQDIVANWQGVGIGGVLLALAYSYRAKLAGAFKSATSTAPVKLDPAEDNRAALSAALCLVSDHVQALGDAAGIDACRALAPLVMLNVPSESEPGPTK